MCFSKIVRKLRYAKHIGRWRCILMQRLEESRARTFYPFERFVYVNVLCKCVVLFCQWTPAVVYTKRSRVRSSWGSDSSVIEHDIYPRVFLYTRNVRNESESCTKKRSVQVHRLLWKRNMISVGSFISTAIARRDARRGFRRDAPSEMLRVTLLGPNRRISVRVRAPRGGSISGNNAELTCFILSETSQWRFTLIPMTVNHSVRPLSAKPVGSVRSIVIYRAMTTTKAESVRKFRSSFRAPPHVINKITLVFSGYESIVLSFARHFHNWHSVSSGGVGFQH